MNNDNEEILRLILRIATLNNMTLKNLLDEVDDLNKKIEILENIIKQNIK